MFLRALPSVLKAREKARGDEKFGVDIIAAALRAPTFQIVSNGGGEGDVIVEQIIEKRGAIGYDVRKREFCDMVKTGIIDPAKVSRVALESAASVSGILLTTEVLVTELKDEKKIIPYAVR